jgi:hypothetical protein
MWYFITHELMPTDTDNYGKRNCKVFMCGVMLYCTSFIILVNLFIYDKISKLLYDALFWVGIIILLSDLCVIAYEYKFFFGRNILNEVAELGQDDNKNKWSYDDNNHTYQKINNSNKLESKEESDTEASEAS